MNGNKENSRIVKTYVCRCGEVNRFSFETDFNFVEVRIDAHCQGCGKDISISVERGLPVSQAQPQYNSYNSYSSGYGSTNTGYQGQQESPSYVAPVFSDITSQDPAPSQPPSPSSNSASFPDFNFDALTSAAESMSSGTQAAQADTSAATPFSTDIPQGETAQSQSSEPLARVVSPTPARKIIDEAEEDKDLLSNQEEETYGEEAAPDEQEAFLDLFGRM